MKYLKTYNESQKRYNSYLPIDNSHDIMDILQDIRDVGFKIRYLIPKNKDSVSQYSDMYFEIFHGDIHRSYISEFELKDEILECIIRLSDYCIEKGFNMSIDVDRNIKNMGIQGFLDSYKGYKINNIGVSISLP